ncbi:MAG: hypothetical protein J6K86_02740 [Clostridia bacterium]|nr:hypothetical protein [Clostridia bacterium]MBP3422664.1 hypothetical protein [Clostridia bacterium]
MDNKLKQYYDKLSLESWIKSGLCGISAGFVAMFISALVFWLTVVKYFWISLIVWVVVSVGATFLCYYVFFKPSALKLARRVDDLGLEERLLTMTHLEGDESYIARRQREDALAALSRVNTNLLKFAITVPMCVIAGVTGILGTGMTTVSGLAANGHLKSGNEIIEEATKEPPIKYEVTYEAGEGGMIEGDMFQIVIEGENAAGVMAVADEEYIFVEWSDGLTNPYREDMNVTESFTVTATFQYVENNDEEGEGTGEGEEPSDKPGQEEGNPQPGEPGDPTEEKPGDNAEAGGRYEAQNQIRDGETYYGDEYEDAYNEAMEEVSQDGDISDGQKDIIGDYFGAIQN